MNAEEKLEELILAGAVEVSAIDSETGELLYSFTDKIHDIDPEMAKQSEEMFNNAIYLLWELGFLNVDMTQESPMVSLMPKALDVEQQETLPKELRLILLTIIEALRLQ